MLREWGSRNRGKEGRGVLIGIHVSHSGQLTRTEIRLGPGSRVEGQVLSRKDLGMEEHGERTGLPQGTHGNLLERSPG